MGCKFNYITVRNSLTADYFSWYNSTDNFQLRSPYLLRPTQLSDYNYKTRMPDLYCCILVSGEAWTLLMKTLHSTDYVQNNHIYILYYIHVELRDLCVRNTRQQHPNSTVRYILYIINVLREHRDCFLCVYFDCISNVLHTQIYM